MIDSKQTSRVVLQVLPHMSAGGLVRGAIDAAAAQVKAGWTALVASEGGYGTHELERLGGRHFALPLASKNPIVIGQNISRLRRLITQQYVDIVHARSRAPAWSAFIAAKQLKRPFVTTFHGTYGHKSRLKRSYNKVMTLGDGVIAISRHIADHIEEVYGVGDERVRVIHRGIDTSLFDPSQVSPERVVNLATNWRLVEPIPVIMMPGRLSRWKGQKVLIEALSVLGRRDIRCLIVGDEQGRSRYRQELETLIKRRSLEEIVHFPGHCRDMPAAYMLSDVVVSASTDPEAFGRVIVEAQAMGRPVVASDHGASRETVLHGKTGWVFPSADPEGLARALRRGLELTVDEREKMSNEAMAHVRRSFTVGSMRRATMQTYLEVLEKAALRNGDGS